MPTSNQVGLQLLSLSAEERLDAVCVRFEAAWRTGTPPCLEEYLSEATPDDRAPLLRELLRLELHYRLTSTPGVDLSDYPTRFPDQAELVRAEVERALARAVHPPRLPEVPGYEVLAELGRGGMGVVYQARQVKADGIVALKMILSGTHATADDLERFQAEARAAARLEHPNIVQVFEVGEHLGLPYFSLEYCPGGSLADRLSGAPLLPEEAARLVQTLAGAIQAAHERDIVHRDLKPENVLLTRDGVPKVSDFGLARELDEVSQTSSGAVIGTPAYMAPEQAAGAVHQIGPATDVHALGVLLYECLTGRPPFRAATVMDTVGQVLHQEPTPLHRLNQAVPRDLETICLKCLEKDPQRRYATAAAVAEELRRFRNREPIAARPASLAERALKWMRRRPAVTALIGVTVAAFALVSWELAAVLRANRETEELRREAERRLTHSDLDRALTLLHQGDTRLGLLRLAHALVRVQEEWFDVEEAAALRHTIRANLSAWGEVTPELRQFFAHPGSLSSAAFSADGHALVTVGSDGKVRVWDVARGVPVSEAPHGEVEAALFSLDGRLHVLTRQPGDRLSLAVEHEPGAATYERYALPGGVPVEMATISPDGRLVAVVGEEIVRLWDVRARQWAGVLEGGTNNGAVAFAPRGERLAVGDGKILRVWDTTEVPGLASPRKALWSVRAHRYAVRALAFSPDGTQLVSGSEDHTACVWDAATGRASGSLLEHQDAVQTVAFSGDGKRVLTSGADGVAVLWDVASGRKWGTGLEHRESVKVVAFQPGSDSVLTATRDGALRLWRPGGDAAPLLQVSHGGDEVMATALSPNPNVPLLVTGGTRGVVRVWDIPTGQRVYPRPQENTPPAHADDVWTIAFDPQGRYFATGSRDETVKLWDATRLQVVRTLSDWDPTERRLRVRCLDFSADGKQLLIGGGGGEQGAAVLWPLESNQPGQLVWQGRSVWQVSFSPNGRTFALSHGDGVVSRWSWDGVTFRSLGQLTQERRRVNALACSPDSRQLLTGGVERTAQLWDAATGRAQGVALRHPGAVWSAAFVDERTVLTGCRDGTARYWDVRVGLPLGPPLRHGGVVWSVASRAADGLCATASEDGTARLWRRPAPLTGSAAQLIRWAEGVTGLTLDEHSGDQLLGVPSWLERRRAVGAAQSERALPASH